jgi:hypothetical protein
MNNKLLIFSLFAIALIGFGNFSCKKKKGTYVVEGTIKDKTFNTGMANLTLTIEVQEAGSSVYSVHSTITTDANGKYQLEVDRGLIDKIRVSGTKTNYFPVEFVIPVSLLSIEETTTLDYETTAKAWAKLIFIHQSGDPNAELQYTKTDGKQDCSECCPKTTQSLFGFVNDTVICVNDGNTNYSYNYIVVGTPTLNSKQCYTPAFDTGVVVLNY